MSSAPRCVMLFLLLFGLSSCIHKPIQPDESKVDKAKMMQWIQTRQAQHQSLSALTQVKMSQNGKSVSTTQALLIGVPNRLRVDMINFFGQLMMQLSVSGPQLNAYVPRDQTHYVGMPTLDNIQRFTQLPLPITELVALLLGQMPLGVIETAQVSAWEKGLIFSTAAGVDYRVEFEGERVVELLYSVNDYTVYQVKYGPYEKMSTYPQQLELTAPMNDIHVVVRFDEVEVNPQFTAQQFQLMIPENAQIRSLSESVEAM